MNRCLPPTRAAAARVCPRSAGQCTDLFCHCQLPSSTKSRACGTAADPLNRALLFRLWGQRTKQNTGSERKLHIHFPSLHAIGWIMHTKWLAGPHMNSLLPDWKPTLSAAISGAAGSSSHVHLQDHIGMASAYLENGQRAQA